MNRKTCPLSILANLLALLTLAVPVLAEADGTVAEARRLTEEGKTEEAIERLLAHHEHAPASAESWTALALAYQARLDEVSLWSKRAVAGDLRHALEEALSLDPEHVEAREELADFYHHAPAIVGGSQAKSEEQIALLARHAPHEALRVQAKYAYEARDFRRAESLLSQAIRLQDDEPLLFYRRGMARLRQLERDTEALEDFERALALGHDPTAVDYRVAQICIRLNTCLDRAEEALRRFLDNSDAYHAQALYRLAQVHELQGRWPEAAEAARSSLELEADLVDTQALLDRVNARLGSGSGR